MALTIGVQARNNEDIPTWLDVAIADGALVVNGGEVGDKAVHFSVEVSYEPGMVKPEVKFCQTFENEPPAQP